MNQLPENRTLFEFDAYQIADVIGRSRTTIIRKKNLKDFWSRRVPNPNGSGRRVDLYRREVLSLWNYSEVEILLMTAEVNKKAFDSEPKLRKKRKLGVINKPRAMSQSARRSLDTWIRDRAKHYYIANPIGDVRNAVYYAIIDWLRTDNNELPADFSDPNDMTTYFYKQRIVFKRDTARFVGHFWRDKWDILHQEYNNRPKANSRTAFATYDYLAIFYKENLLRRGFGAGQMWFIDGTKFDSILKAKDGSPLRPTQFIFSCALTNYPIWVEPIYSENTDDIIQMFMKVVQLVGVPRYGIVVDNSTAFRSEKFRNFVKSLYSEEDLKVTKGNLFKALLGEQADAPVFYPPKEVPNSPLKGKGERGIKELNRLIGRVPETAKTWQASRERRRLPFDSLALPPIQKIAEEAGLAWGKYYDAIYGKFVMMPRTTALRTFSIHAGQHGLRGADAYPCVHSAFEFYGGFDEANRLPICEENIAIVSYFVTPENDKHLHINIESTVIQGMVTVTHKGVIMNYVLEELADMMWTGEKITVLIHPDDDSRANLYLTETVLLKDLIPENGVYFIGEARLGRIESLKDIAPVRSRINRVKTKSAKIRQQKMDEFEQMEEAEFIVVDDSRQIESLPIPKKLEIHHDIPALVEALMTRETEAEIGVYEGDHHTNKTKREVENAKKKKNTSEIDWADLDAVDDFLGLK